MSEINTMFLLERLKHFMEMKISFKDGDNSWEAYIYF